MLPPSRSTACCLTAGEESCMSTVALVRKLLATPRQSLNKPYASEEHAAAA